MSKTVETVVWTDDYAWTFIQDGNVLTCYYIPADSKESVVKLYAYNMDERRSYRHFLTDLMSQARANVIASNEAVIDCIVVVQNAFAKHLTKETHDVKRNVSKVQD